MDAEVKAKWIIELKSEKYKRGSGLLKAKRSDGKISHCCLGVLCEIYKEETGKGQWDDTKWSLVGVADYYYKFSVKEPGSSSTVLPPEVEQWAHINGSSGYFNLSEEDMEKLNILMPGMEKRSAGELSFLTEVNDASLKEDFSDVIPFIEKYF